MLFGLEVPDSGFRFRAEEAIIGDMVAIIVQAALQKDDAIVGNCLAIVALENGHFFAV